MNRIINNQQPIPMKEIGSKGELKHKEYLSLPPEKTHTKEELEALHRAIEYTHKYKMQESLDKMDEESPIIHTLPRR